MISSCQVSESRSRFMSRYAPKNSAVAHRHWRRGQLAGNIRGVTVLCITAGQDYRADGAVVSLTRHIARAGAIIGASARSLAQSFIESTGIRRKSVRERRQGLRRAVRASRLAVCVRAVWHVVPGAQLGNGGASGWVSTLYHQPCEEFDAFRQSRRLWTAGRQRAPFEAAGDAPRAKEAWRAVGLPDVNPRLLGGPGRGAQARRSRWLAR